MPWSLSILPCPIGVAGLGGAHFVGQNLVREVVRFTEIDFSPSCLSSDLLMIDGWQVAHVVERLDNDPRHV